MSVYLRGKSYHYRFLFKGKDCFGPCSGCTTDTEGCIHDGFVYFPNLKENEVFLYRIFEVGACYAGLGKLGTQLNLNTDTVGAIRIGLPPLNEQRTISDFLDRETGKIDDLIQKREDLIALLQEKRSALISHAVTKGLDPNVKIKPSGIDWLGDIPEHWRNIKLKWYSRRYTGGTPDKSNDAFWEDGIIPWLNSGAVNDLRITAPSAYITQDAYVNSSAKWVPKGALLIALAGQGKTKGMVARLMFRATCNQSMAAIISDSRLNTDYLFWWLTKNYTNIRNLGGGDSRDGINLEMLGGIVAPFPPIVEQDAIAAFLDRETGKIDSLIEKENQLIEKMKEYRTALISAAVTGKIDVRGNAR